MDYFCKECDLVISEDDVVVKECYLAEAWGRPIYEKYPCCPRCGAQVSEYDGQDYGKPVVNSIDPKSIGGVIRAIRFRKYKSVI